MYDQLSLLSIQGLGMASTLVHLLPLLGLISFVGIILYGYRRLQSLLIKKKSLEHEIQRQRKLNQEQSIKLTAIEVSKAKLFQNVMEEIRSPLAAIVQMNHAILHDKFGKAPTNVKGASRLALESGKRLHHMVQELLEIASFGHSCEKPCPQCLDFFEYIHTLYQSLLEEAQIKKIHIGFNYQLGKELRLTFDPQKFKQVFTTLVKNAIKCSPPASQIIISLYDCPRENKIHISVEDSSKGLCLEEIRHIFDAYFQTDYKKAFHQYGPTPALLRNYAHVCEGDLKVDSTPGRGTTFTFSFPKSTESFLPIDKLKSPTDPIRISIPKSEKIETPAKEKKALQVKYRGLLAGNEESWLQSIQQYVEPTYLTLFARGVSETQKVLLSYNRKIDFILCGGGLATEDDCLLLRQIKRHKQHSRIPVFVLSEEIKASSRIKSLNLGIDEYLIYPFQPEDLIHKIENWVDVYTNRDEWHCQGEACQSSKVKITDADLIWLTKMESLILAEMRNRQFNLGELAYQMGTSERQLYRKVKELTGKNAQ